MLDLYLPLSLVLGAAVIAVAGPRIARSTRSRHRIHQRLEDLRRIRL